MPFLFFPRLTSHRLVLFEIMHYNDGIMGAVASQITRLTIVYSTVDSGADQRKHQSSTSLAFVRGIHRGPVNSPHKWPVTRKMVPFDDVIMELVPRRWPGRGVSHFTWRAQTSFRGFVSDIYIYNIYIYPDSKVHGPIMGQHGPIWGRQDPGGPHVGSKNFDIWVLLAPRLYQVGDSHLIKAAISQM